MRRLARSARWLTTTTGGLGPLESERASERLTSCQSTLLQSLGHLLRPSPDAAGCASATLRQPALAETLSERYNQTACVSEIKIASQGSSHSSVRSCEEGQQECSTRCPRWPETPTRHGSELPHTAWPSQGTTRHGLVNLSNNVHSIHQVLPQHGSLRPLSSYPAAAAAAVAATAEGSSSSSSVADGGPAPRRGRKRNLDDLDLLPPRSRRLLTALAGAAPAPSAAPAAALAAIKQPSVSAFPGPDQPASPGRPGPTSEPADSERVHDTLNTQEQGRRTSARPATSPAPQPPLPAGTSEPQAGTEQPQPAEPWERPGRWARALPSATAAAARSATASAAVPAVPGAPAAASTAAPPSPTSRAHLVDVRLEDLPYGSFQGLLQALKCGAAPPPPKELLGLALKKSPRPKSMTARRNVATAEATQRERGGLLVKPQPGDAEAVNVEEVDMVLVPLLQGPYGDGLTDSQYGTLLYLCGRHKWWGELSRTAVRRLADCVRQDMSYSSEVVWPTLSMWALGKAAQLGAKHPQQQADGRVPGHGGRSGASGSASPAAGAAATAAAAKEALLPRLVQLLARNAHSMNQQGLTNTVWAMGHLRHKDLGALAAFGRAMRTKTFTTGHSQHVANSVYGIALLEPTTSELETLKRETDDVLGHLLAGARQLAGQWAILPQELANTVWACGKMGLRDEKLLDSASTCVLKTFNGSYRKEIFAKGQEWSNLLYGMALLKYYNSDVFQGLTTAVRPPTRFRDVPAPLPVGAPYHPETDRQYDEKIAKTGWAPCVEPPRDPRVYSSMLTSATSQAVSNILFALGVLRYLDEELVDELSLRLVAYGTAVTYSDLALALRAFVQVNYKPSGLMQLLENLEAKLRQGHKRDLMAHNLLWSIAAAGLLPSHPHLRPLVALLVKEVNRHAGVMAMHGREYNWDEASQIVQYHWESRAAGLVGPEYDITFVEPMLAMMRNHRLQMATEAPALVEQGRVYKALKAMAASGTYPGLLGAQHEVLLVAGERGEGGVCAVDVLVTMRGRRGSEGSSSSGSNSRAGRTGSETEGSSSSDSDSEGGGAGEGDSGGGGGGGEDVGDPGGGGSNSGCGADGGDGDTYLVAVEVDGPTHFMANRPDRTDGRTAMRNRTLARMLGPRNVVCISTKELVVKLKTEEARRQALWERLQGTEHPGPGFQAARPWVEGAEGGRR